MTAIVGAGVIPFGKYPERSVESLGLEATRLAITDSGFTAKRINAGYFANALGARLFGATTIGQSICADAGIRGVPILNVENACTSGSTAFHLAWQAIEAQQCDVAIVVGAEKMSSPRLGLIDSGLTDPDTLLGLVTPASFALRARRHMYEFGTTNEQMAMVAVKSRQHAALNPYAQFRRVESMEEVLAGPMIADPLTRSQCCPVADGAAAVILCSDRIARSCRKAVRVRHSVLVSGSYPSPTDLVRWETDYRAAGLAYEGAAIGPQDIDIVECHDAFTIAEILHYEALGLCPPGEGGLLVASGDTGRRGRIPVNVSGGLLSRGHPVGATGVAQIVELVFQLRGTRGALQVDGCQTALAHCMGGDRAGDAKSCTVVVLSR